MQIGHGAYEEAIGQACRGCSLRCVSSVPGYEVWDVSRWTEDAPALTRVVKSKAGSCTRVKVSALSSATFRVALSNPSYACGQWWLKIALFVLCVVCSTAIADVLYQHRLR